jgi:tetratricopeptide (TPR) repeat protein
LATLTAPDPRGIEHLRFGPDGSRLAAVCTNRTVRVWDLRRIRGRLAEMGLDWDGPPYPPASGETAGPLRVEVLPGAPPAPVRQPRKDDPRSDLERANEAVANGPGDADAYYRRGLVRMRLRDFAGARDDFGRAIALRPGHTEAHHQRGHAHERLGQPARAVEDFTAALRGQPESAHFYEARGRNHFALREHAKALEDLRRALAIRPDDPAACNFLAWVHVMGPPGLRSPDKALPLAERATQLAPGAAQNWQTLGTVHHRLGKAREALAALERGVGLKKGGATAHDLFVMAMCHRRLGDKARAEECYAKALRWQEENKGKLSPFQAEALGTLRAEAEAAVSKPPKP